MTKPTDIRITEVRSRTEQVVFRTPIKFGGRVLNEAMLFHVEMDVETRDGRRGMGLGSMPVGNVWAWPSGQVSTAQSLAAMTALGQRLVDEASRYGECGHPLDITHDLAATYRP